MLGGLMGLAMLSELGMNNWPVDSPKKSFGSARKVCDGHTSWNNNHNAKTRTSRAKERRAKTARKINWN